MTKIDDNFKRLQRSEQELIWTMQNTGERNKTKLAAVSGKEGNLQRPNGND